MRSDSALIWLQPKRRVKKASPKKMKKTRAERKVKAAAYKRNHRRRLLLRNALGSLGLEAFSPEELFQLLCGCSREARLTLTRSRRRNAVRPFAKKSRVQQKPGVLPRPNRILSRLNRSSVFPPLVSNDDPIEEVAIGGILAALHNYRKIHPPHRLLDQLAVASGFPWKTCADLLYAMRIVDQEIDNHELEATQQARSFWNRVQHGRARYARLVAKGQIPRLTADLAFFESSQFQRLLPGIVIPTRLRRHEYLTSWVRDGGSFSLDVYAGFDGAPLFRHPFPERFNPLFFGRPRQDTKRVRGRRN
jgi:hypothetical protein